MYDNLQIKLLNTKDELESFPIDQSISLEFSESVEDSFLQTYIFLVQGMDSPDLIHVGDTYNQNIGIVKESYKNVDLDITVVSREPFVVKVTPLKPLTPGYSYTLLIKGDLPNEYMAVTKINSHSSSKIELLDSTAYNEEVLLTINADSSYTSSSHVIDISLKGVRQTFNIKNNNTVVFQGYTLKFVSDLYIEGETFNIIVMDKTAATTTFTAHLTTSPSKNVKPIDPSANIKLTEEDIIAFNEGTTNSVAEPLTQTLIYTGTNSFIISFNNEIVDLLDLDALTFSIRESFGMYTLPLLDLYDKNKQYSIVTNILDTKNIEFTITEVVV